MRNCVALSTRNGTASFTHGVGSHAGSVRIRQRLPHTGHERTERARHRHAPVVSLGEHRVGRHRADLDPLVLGLPVRDSRKRGVVRRLQRCMLGREEHVQHPERRSRGRSLWRSLREAAVDEIRPPVPVDRVDARRRRAPCTIATKMLAAGGAEAIPGCATTVFTAISFHFVTSLAEEATAGTASASARPSTARRPIRIGFIALVLFSPEFARTSTSFPQSVSRIKCHAARQPLRARR